MDYLIPTAWETPKFELGETVTPSPHHPIGAKGVGESATVGSPAAYVNAVIDALRPLGVKNIDMPLTSREGVGGDRGGEGGDLRVKPDVLELAAELRARGRAVRAGHGRVEPGAVVGQARRHGADHARPPDPRMARRRVRGADRRSARRCGARGGHAAAALPRHARGAGGHRARRRRDRADRVSERRRAGGLRGTRPAVAAARRRSAARPPWTRSPGWRPRSAGAPWSWTTAATRRSPAAGRAITELDLRRGVDDRSFVVVATQGHYDEDALERALATPAAYVGLVASRKRAASVLGYLRDRGVPRGRARPRARARRAGPGPRRPTEEIAVAILAEIVQLRAAGDAATPAPRPTPPRRVTRRSTPCAG